MKYKLKRELPFANIGDVVWVHIAQKWIEVESTKYEIKRFIGMGNYDDLDDYILEGWIEEVKPVIPETFYIVKALRHQDIPPEYSLYLSEEDAKICLYQDRGVIGKIIKAIEVIE